MNGNINSGILTNEIKSNIIFGGDTESLSIIDNDSHELIDSVQLGNIITCLDNIYTDDGQILTIIGCNNGDILIRKNFEIINKKFNFSRFKTITCIKFCQDYTSFILSNIEGVIIFVTIQKSNNEKNINKDEISNKNTNREEVLIDNSILDENEINEESEDDDIEIENNRLNIKRKSKKLENSELRNNLNSKNSAAINGKFILLNI